MVVSHSAGVGGWCLAELSNSKESEGGDCQANDSSIEGPFQGPIVAEAGNPLAFWKGGSLWVKRVVVLTTAQVAAVSYQGYKPIGTHASKLLPDHLRGALIELRGRASKPLAAAHFPKGHLIAWSRSGKPIPQTFTKGRPLAFGVPVRSWSNSAPAQHGVCGISVTGVPGLELQSGGVISEIEPHADVLGREYLDCAHSYYELNGKWPLDAYMLLDAAHPGTTPASLPGMRPFARHSGVLIGPGPGSGELARRIPGAWLVVTAGEGISQRLMLLEHLHATLHLH